MGTQHHGTARRFITATGFHAHVAVFDDIDPTDAVGAGDFVQVLQHLVRLHFLAVDGHDVTFAVGQLDVGRLIRCLLRRHAPAPHIVLGLGPGILQVHALVGNVQQVGIHGVRAFAFFLLNRDAALVAVRQQLLTGIQVPLAPRGDHFDAGLESVGTQLEAHLVVALAGSAVGNGIGTGFVGNLHQALGDQRAGNGGTQQVLPFIDGIGPEHREHVVAHELFAQVLNIDFLDPQRFRLGPCRLHFLALTNVGGESHHLAVVGILQPPDDHGRIQTTGIGQHHLFDIRHALAPD